jgi:hypothetical protein
MAIVAFLVAGVLTTIIVLAMLFVFGKLPVLAQVKQAALS